MNQVTTTNDWDRSKLDLIKSLYFKGSTDEEFNLFVHVAKHTGLDPCLRQIYPVKRWDQTEGKNVMTIQTGIDGLRLIADRTGNYSPGREPTFQYDPNGNLLSATAYIKKRTSDGTWHEISATAFYEEYVQKTKSGEPTKFWKNMKHGQLAKCAEALAIRKGFPGDTSKIYADEEMQQAEVGETIESKQIPMPTSENISKDQAHELSLLLLDCDPKYQENVWKTLKSIGVDAIEKIPQNLYERIKNAAVKKREEYCNRFNNEVLEEAL